MNKADMQGKMKVMLEMQDALNQQVFPDWAQRKLAWHRAIYIEAGEYLEHLGSWKWWKKGSPDFPQANMELVDIWHFGLSWFLESLARSGTPDFDALARFLGDTIEVQWPEVDLTEDPDRLMERRHQAVDHLVGEAGLHRCFNLGIFLHLLAYSGMDFDELYRRYVGKNVLNRFRQDNGYKTGTYVKVWAGREDNEHLNELLDFLPVDEHLPANVLKGLQGRYTRLALNAA